MKSAMTPFLNSVTCGDVESQEFHHIFCEEGMDSVQPIKLTGSVFPGLETELSLG